MFFFILEFIGHKLFNVSFSLSELVCGFLTGGWGKGSYYIFLQFQLILLFPILLYFLKKTLWCGVGALVLVQTIYQYIIVVGRFEQFYRLSLMRCMVFVLAGILLYWYEDRIKNRDLFFVGLIGLLLVMWVTYDTGTQMIFPYRRNTSMPTVLWATFLVCISYRKFERLPSVIDKCIMKIGQSSLWILFIQMLYYRFLHDFQESIGNEIFRVIINCAICCGIGILAKEIEDLIKKKRGKKNEGYRSNTGTL